MLIKLFIFIKQAITSIFLPKQKPYQTVFTEELDDTLKKRTIYILGEGEYLWSAAMLCPCGCGEVLHMSLHKDGRPRWELSKHPDGTVSLWPSIWRKRGCGSHFFFQHGYVKWCDNNMSQSNNEL